MSNLPFTEPSLYISKVNGQCYMPADVFLIGLFERTVMLTLTDLHTYISQHLQ
jgi:hypothetical protein